MVVFIIWSFKSSWGPYHRHNQSGHIWEILPNADPLRWGLCTWLPRLDSLGTPGHSFWSPYYRELILSCWLPLHSLSQYSYCFKLLSGINHFSCPRPLLIWIATSRLRLSGIIHYLLNLGSAILAIISAAFNFIFSVISWRRCSWIPRKTPGNAKELLIWLIVSLRPLP